MENYMQKVMIKKCLVYILNNIFLFILLNCNSNNYLLSKYTLSTNLVLCFFSILMIFNNEYIFCSILNIYQIFKNEIIIRQSRKKYLETIIKNMLKIIIIKIIIDILLNLIFLKCAYILNVLAESVVLFFCFFCLKKSSYSIIFSTTLLMILKKYYSFFVKG